MLKLVIPGMNYPFVPTRFILLNVLGRVYSAVTLSSFFHQSSVAATEISVLFLKFYAESFICETVWKQ